MYRKGTLQNFLSFYDKVVVLGISKSHVLGPTIENCFMSLDKEILLSVA